MIIARFSWCQLYFFGSPRFRACPSLFFSVLLQLVFADETQRTPRKSANVRNSLLSRPLLFFPLCTAFLLAVLEFLAVDQSHVTVAVTLGQVDILATILASRRFTRGQTMI